MLCHVLLEPGALACAPPPTVVLGAAARFGGDVLQRRERLRLGGVRQGPGGGGARHVEGEGEGGGEGSLGKVLGLVAAVDVGAFEERGACREGRVQRHEAEQLPFDGAVPDRAPGVDDAAGGAEAGSRERGVWLEVQRVDPQRDVPVQE
eukprot:1907431-Rhodomonas_salina.1